MFIKVIEIVSIFSKLLKTVGLFGVRLNLAKIRLKNWKEVAFFDNLILVFLTKI